METFDRGIRTGEKILSKKSAKERKNILPLIQDLYFTKYSIHVSKQQYLPGLEEVRRYADVTKELYGEKTS